MRPDGMEALGAVNRWLDLARVLLAKHAQLPLIDDGDIDMHAELYRARKLGDDSLRAAIKNRWPAFVRLTVEDRQRRVTGSWLLGTNLPDGAGLAVHCFARIVERGLRTRIFVPIAEHARSRPEITASCTGDPFSRYLKGCDKNFGLGQMFKVLGFARRPASPLISSFAEWLKRGYPWLLAGLAPLRTDRIVDFRNREDHPDVRPTGSHEAEESSRICREAIDLLCPR